MPNKYKSSAGRRLFPGIAVKECSCIFEKNVYTNVLVRDASGYGGIGRRARFRFWCPVTCRFKSCYPHEMARNRVIQVSRHFAFGKRGDYPRARSIAILFHTIRFSRLFPDVLMSFRRISQGVPFCLHALISNSFRF